MDVAAGPGADGHASEAMTTVYLEGHEVPWSDIERDCRSLDRVAVGLQRKSGLQWKLQAADS